MADYETILVEQRGGVTLITLNRPKALNALNSQVLAELLAALAAFDADASQGCAVLTGSEKAFAAGADIKEMSSQGFATISQPGPSRRLDGHRHDDRRRAVVALDELDLLDRIIRKLHPTS